MLTEAWTHRLARLRRGADSLRLHDPGAGVQRRAGAHRARDQQGVAEDRAGALRKICLAIMENSREMLDGATAGAPGSPAGREASRRRAARRRTWTSSPSTSPRTPRTGKIDPVLGRDFEIRQMVDILMRRRQNNPILTGEAGVGKTAVVEGFALRVAQGDVPPPAAQCDGAHARPGPAAGRRRASRANSKTA